MTISFNIFYVSNVIAVIKENEELVNINLETKEITKEIYVKTSERTVQNNRTEPYIPEAVRNDSRMIIGGDDRSEIGNTNVHPFSTICYIETKFSDGSVTYGTAVMIYKNLAITAGHCVYSPDKGAPESVKVWPGRKEKESLFGYVNVLDILLNQTYIDYANSNEDWALLTLSGNIGDACGWSGIAFSDDYSYFANGEKVRVTGYPTEKGIRQYTGYGDVIGASDIFLAYEVDTTGGQSGSPVYDKGGYVIGIHIAEGAYDGRPANICSNITRNRFNTFVEKMK